MDRKQKIKCFIGLHEFEKEPTMMWMKREWGTKCIHCGRYKKLGKM